LSQLSAAVRKAIEIQSGGEVTLWQDVDAISYGADWAADIEGAIGQTTFLIPHRDTELSRQHALPRRIQIVARPDDRARAQ
jgi:hypothetical protein